MFETLATFICKRYDLIVGTYELSLSLQEQRMPEPWETQSRNPKEGLSKHAQEYYCILETNPYIVE